MRHLAITLVHNKTPEENEAQIQALLPLVQRQTETHDEYDGEGNVVGQFDTYYYTLTGFPKDYQVRFFQIVPFGVERPPSMDLLDSHKVIYGAGDEDKTGDHPRFFNWGNKRGTDHGAEAVIHLEDHAKFDPSSLLTNLKTVLDRRTKTELLDDASCKVVSVKALRETGQLDESKSKAQAFEEYKGKLEQKGLRNG